MEAASCGQHFVFVRVFFVPVTRRAVFDRHIEPSQALTTELPSEKHLVLSASYSRERQPV